MGSDLTSQEPGRPQPADPLRCPTCDSPQPSMHPAFGGGGEVTSLCPDPFHGAPAVPGPQGVALEAAVVRAARRWYYEHGFKAGYLPRNVLGSDRDLKLAVEQLDTAAPAAPLRLPQVPEGTVALKGNRSGRRYSLALIDGSLWTDDLTGQEIEYVTVLRREQPDGVTPEFAPERERRTWPKLDGPPADLQAFDLLDKYGNPIEHWTRRSPADSYWTDPSGRLKRQTWSQIRARGEIREVLNP